MTPRHGRELFSKCDIPACYVFKNMEVKDDEDYQAAILAVAAWKVFYDTFNNSVFIFFTTNAIKTKFILNV